MSFDANDMINPSNYEEYFILYMDNELDAAGKAMVESFVAQHPHLAEELEILMTTKLPVDDVSFEGKEELLSPVMKVAAADENLLLYIDNELPAAERKLVEKKITADNDYALQHTLLLQAKLNGKEVISYPNKKELYRHERKVVPFGFWMRIAAAVIVLLSGSLFYLFSNKQLPVNSDLAKHTDEKVAPVHRQTATPVEQTIEKAIVPGKDVASVKTTDKADEQKQLKRVVDVGENRQQQATASVDEQSAINKHPEAVRLDGKQLTSPAIEPIAAVNKTIAPLPVTSKTDSSYNKQNSATNNPEVDWAVETTEKKTPARGFFRKVSRFIERKTGIGTANADNELLIGSVALKLK